MRSSLACLALHLCATVMATCLFAVSAGAQNPPAPPPIAEFFANPEFSDVQLSPDARHLAVLVLGPNGRERLAVVNLANNSIKVVAQFDDVDVGEVEWVNPERLVLSTRDYQTAPGEQR